MNSVKYFLTQKIRGMADQSLSKLALDLENTVKDYIRGWLEAGGIADFVKFKGLTTDEAILQIMDASNTKKPVVTRQPKAAGETVTLEMLKAMIEDDFIDNWFDDGDHCVYFLGGRSAPRNGKTHVFCGVPGGIICKEHMKPAEGKRICEEHKNGKFDLTTHKCESRKKRVKYAQGKLKAADETTTSSTLNTLTKANKKAFATEDYELDRNLKYVSETGLLIKRSAANDRWIAVGVATSASSEINKLSVNDIDALGKMEITAEDDALSDEARAYVNNIRTTQDSSRHTFTSTRSAAPSNGTFSTRIRRAPAKTSDEITKNDDKVDLLKEVVVETPPSTMNRMPTSQQRRTIQGTAKPVMPGDDN